MQNLPARRSPGCTRTTTSTRLLERAPFYNNPPVESDEFVTFEEVQTQWQEVKAAPAS